MRNLKRALSLGLTAAMISGLMVMGSSAASYADVTSENNVEAIEVLESVGIMIGDESGNFNPDQNVTRNEMAVVMANLMEYNVASYKDTSPFTDVPSWAEPYVAACWTNGITAGYSDTIYGGSDTVTTAQAALMLMKALGYFQYSSDFGGDWQLATTRQGNAIDLFNGVDSGVTQAMTRNDVAQLVLNTLEAGTVQATTNGNFTIGDVTVATSVQYDFITSGESFARAINSELYTSNDGTVSTGSIVQLGEQLYRGDLIKSEDQDKFGRPSNIWEYNGQEIGTYEDEASFTYTAKVNSKALYNDVGRNAAENYEWYVYKNGVEVEDYGKGDLAANRSNDDDDFVALEVGGSNYTGTGVLTQVYVDSLDEKVYVSIMDTYAGEVSDVDEDSVTIRQLKPGDKANPSLDSRTFEMANPSFEDGDIVLYTQADGELMSVVAAESVSGTVTAYQLKDENQNRDSYAELDDTRYTYSFNMASNLEDNTNYYPSGLGDDYVFYLDTYGNLIAFEGVESLDDFLFVEKAISDAVGVRAFVTFSDGTQQTIQIHESRVDETASYQDATTTNVVNGGVYTFSENNGIYSLTGLQQGTTNDKYKVLDKPNGTSFFDGNAPAVGESAYSIKQGHSRMYPVEVATLSGSGEVATWTDLSGTYPSYTVNNSTVFVDVDDAEVYIGYDAVPTYAAVKAVAVFNQQGVAKLVFISDQYDKSNAGIYFFVDGDSTHNYQDGNTTVRTYNVYIDGQQQELETRGVTLRSDSIYEITAMNANEQVTDVRLVLDNYNNGESGDRDGQTALIKSIMTNTDAYRQVKSVIGNEITLNSSLSEFANKSVYRWNDEETVFTTIETEYDRNGNVVVDQVKPGDINDIDIDASGIANNNALVYIVSVDDETELTPTALQVFIVVKPDADNLATVSFNNGNYLVNGNAPANISVVKGNNVTFTLADGTEKITAVRIGTEPQTIDGSGSYTFTLNNVRDNVNVVVTTEVDNSASLKYDFVDAGEAYISVNNTPYTTDGELSGYEVGQAVEVIVNWIGSPADNAKLVTYGASTPILVTRSGNQDTYLVTVNATDTLTIDAVQTYTLTLPNDVGAKWAAADGIPAGSIAANGSGATGEVPAGAVVTLNGSAFVATSYLMVDKTTDEYLTNDTGLNSFTMTEDAEVMSDAYVQITEDVTVNMDTVAAGTKAALGTVSATVTNSNKFVKANDAIAVTIVSTADIGTDDMGSTAAVQGQFTANGATLKGTYSSASDLIQTSTSGWHTNASGGVINNATLLALNATGTSRDVTLTLTLTGGSASI